MQIETPRGPIEIVAPTVELLVNLRELLPYGICKFEPPQNGADYGFVMQVDEREVYGIKQQPKETEQGSAERWMEVQHWMCVEALSLYIAHGFSGAYLPAPYLRPRENDLWEAGVSHFVFPSARGIEALEFPFKGAFDANFGHGATTMFEHFARHFMAVFRASPITPPAYFGLDIRPRLHLGRLGMYFMALGGHIICLRANLRAREDAAWTILASAGIEQVIHIPSFPLAIPQSDLATTKGPKN